MSENANLEVSHHLSEHKREGDESKGSTSGEIVEILEALLLAAVAIATAWSGYQAAKWDGRNALYYGQASKDRLIATRASTLAGHELLYDANTFNFWGAARIRGEPTLMAFYVKRFTPDYRVAFEAWLRVIRHNPGKAPFGPSNMPQYHNPAAAQGKAEDAVASKTFQEGTDARDTGDKYVRSTVFWRRFSS